MLVHVAGELARYCAHAPFTLVKLRRLVVHVVDLDIERRCGTRVDAIDVHISFGGLAEIERKEGIVS